MESEYTVRAIMSQPQIVDVVKHAVERLGEAKVMGVQCTTGFHRAEVTAAVTAACMNQCSHFKVLHLALAREYERDLHHSVKLVVQWMEAPWASSRELKKKLGFIRQQCLSRPEAVASVAEIELWFQAIEWDTPAVEIADESEVDAPEEKKRKVTPVAPVPKPSPRPAPAKATKETPTQSKASATPTPRPTQKPPSDEVEAEVEAEEVCEVARPSTPSPPKGRALVPKPPKSAPNLFRSKILPGNWLRILQEHGVDFHASQQLELLYQQDSNAAGDVIWKLTKERDRPIENCSAFVSRTITNTRKSMNSW